MAGQAGEAGAAAPPILGYRKIVGKSFLSENFRPEMQKSGAKKHILRKFGAKIET